ncbi:DUF6913 domain-containing protein [Mangrovibacterium marinum]|uniref:Uncharacterized protein n=1 Tax=Mangrovibacterium marinum TaxID=1639118 RepID=A0A2T5C4A8_9BACT|nr:hypothetical protein [Mangrovibacterium marinum]PTN09655.1 hypothetical protein C8N47_104202 [Mangrovibacterium marinum]
MGLKSKLVYWRLRRIGKSTKRSKQFINLNKAGYVGILWDEKDNAAFEMLKSYLQGHNIQYRDLCYSAKEHERTFGKNDFSFMGTPKNPEVATFINEKFDLLIDISLSDKLPVQIVRALSGASFKTGWSMATPNFFDLCVDVSKHPDACYLAEQLIHYLNEIN